MKIDIKRIVGGNIKKLRKQNGLSQKQLAEGASVKIQAISLIETGKTYPLPETLAKICKKFQVSPSVLFSIDKAKIPADLKNREELMGALNIILSEMDNDKLEILISIMAILAEESVEIKIKR